MKISSTFQRKRARIEIIPLIDIIFFLLATFVMVSLAMVKNQGITIKLPVAATGQQLDRTVSKTVTVTKNGDVFLDKENMGLEAICARLKEMKAQNQDMNILINGDESTNFGLVVKTLDAIRKVGISKVSIQTRGSEVK